MKGQPLYHVPCRYYVYRSEFRPAYFGVISGYDCQIDPVFGGFEVEVWDADANRTLVRLTARTVGRAIRLARRALNRKGFEGLPTI